MKQFFTDLVNADTYPHANTHSHALTALGHAQQPDRRRRIPRWHGESNLDAGSQRHQTLDLRVKSRG